MWFLTLRKAQLRLPEIKVLTRVLRHTMNEEAGGKRKLHNEELCDYNLSPDVVSVIKLTGMRLPGHVACMEGKRMHTNFGWKA